MYEKMREAVAWLKENRVTITDNGRYVFAKAEGSAWVYSEQLPPSYNEAVLRIIERIENDRKLAPAKLPIDTQMFVMIVEWLGRSGWQFYTPDIWCHPTTGRKGTPADIFDEFVKER